MRVEFNLWKETELVTARMRCQIKSKVTFCSGTYVLGPAQREPDRERLNRVRRWLSSGRGVLMKRGLVAL